MSTFRTKKVILDTTYVLPVFGIEIDLSSDSVLQIEKLWREGLSNYDLILPSTCLIEVAYKLNAIYRHKNDAKILNRLPEILPTILKSRYITIFHPDSSVSATEMAMKIRNAGHTDLMDCWIAGSAFALDGIFLTEESDLKRILNKITEFSSIPIWDWRNLQKQLN